MITLEMESLQVRLKMKIEHKLTCHTSFPLEVSLVDTCLQYLV